MKEGDPVILKPDKEIKKDDVIQWLLGDEKLQTRIAEYTEETGQIEYDDGAADGIFRGRLKLDRTGCLIIRNSTTADSGLYTVYITSSGVVSKQTFILTVNGE